MSILMSASSKFQLPRRCLHLNAGKINSYAVKQQQQHQLYSTSENAASNSPPVDGDTENPPAQKTERKFFKFQEEIDGFKVFDVYMNKYRGETNMFDKIKRTEVAKTEKDKFARYNRMSLNQDWTNVWPTKSMFKQSAVPLAVRQGFVKRNENGGVPPEKYGNTELIKIPNFFHLTPVHIKKHCEAIKKFCTKWPEGLDKNVCETYFPIETTTSTYIYDGPSIRDDRARIVTLKIKVSSLKLNKRSKDKFIKLAEHRYDAKSDILTLVADRCPYRRQNEAYANYLLTTLYFEAKKIEQWEKEMEEDDRRSYIWDLSKSKKNILKILGKMEEKTKPEEVAAAKKEKLDAYKKSLTQLFNKGESEKNINSYKDSVLKILNLKTSASTS